tara:strand:- start:3978 stop:5480 length:1503 start_codon:yes stop_codon:yes gene_type:complete
MSRSLGFDISKLLEENGKIKVSKMEDVSSLPQGNIVAYANFAAFPTNPSAGQIAFDTAKDIYYFWNESEWQRIDTGFDNTAPTLTTTLPSTLELNTDGTTSTLSIAGTDADADNLSYSWDIVQGSNYYSPERNNGLPDQIASIASGYETTGNFVITPSTDTSHAGNFVFRAKASDGIKSVSSSTTVNISFTVPAGSFRYSRWNQTSTQTTDTYNAYTAWVVPAGVTSISAVCIAGGGAASYCQGGSNWSGAGGGGGAMAYGTFDVTPGETLWVYIGSGGRASSNSSSSGRGGHSGIGRGATRNTTSNMNNNVMLLKAFGGHPGLYGNAGAGNGGGSSGTERDGGGNGGYGGQARSNNGGGGGGGAGGYSGTGGNGGIGNSGVGGNGAGSAAGGGGGMSSGGTAQNSGGGTDVYGLTNQGSGGQRNNPGTGGSGGQAGSTKGGRHGGGGGGREDDTSGAGGHGAGGVVRIIWGGTQPRSFPSTRVTNAYNDVAEVTMGDSY